MIRCLIAIVALLVAAGTVAAQPSTPVTAVPCTVAPRTVAGIREVVGRAMTFAPIPDPIPYAVPAGAPADRGTVQHLHATLLELSACVNDGDTLRFSALVSDDFLRRHAEVIGLPAGEPDGVPDNAPLSPAERLSLAGVRDVTRLPDGRVAALVRFDQGEREAPELLSLITFVEQDGRLLVDEWQPVTLDATPTPAAGWAPVSGAGYAGVIVPAAEAAEFVYGLTGTEVQGSWTPSGTDIAVLEASLPDALRAAPGVAPDLADRLPGYKRQYAGFVTSGRARIYVNAFCDPGLADWRSQPVFVLDGGDCFFQAVYEPGTATFVTVSINGEA